MKDGNIQINIVIKKDIKDKLDRMSRMRSYQEDKDISSIDIIRELIDNYINQNYKN